MTDQLLHCCKEMKAQEIQDEKYSYRWAAHHGWSLYLDDQPLPNHRWCARCDWCCHSLPGHDHYIPDKVSEHRCLRMLHMEWSMRRQDRDAFYLVEWDGFEWIATDCGEVIQKHLKTCPYCNEELRNPRAYRNSVEIK